MNIDLFKESKLYLLFITWHFLATITAFIFGVVNQDFDLFFPLAMWSIVAIFAYYYEPPRFFATVVGLMLLQRIVLFVWGGVGSEGINLWSDLLTRTPMMLGFIIGWYLALRKYEIDERDLYIMAGLHGLAVELIFTGAFIADPITLFYLGGPVMFLYGSLLVTPKRLIGKHVFTPQTSVFYWLLTFFFIMVGSIIGNELNILAGFT